MNTPIDDLIRSTLTDLAEEAVPMNLADSAVDRARKRRTLTVSVGVAGVVAALMVGTPLAFAAVNRDAPPPSAPADQAPAASPSLVPISPVPNGPDLPPPGKLVSPVPIDPDLPSPVPTGPDLPPPGKLASPVPIDPGLPSLVPIRS
ncbi:hypothetical protein SAMN05443287_11644 [Micromonospora phaseoli]|uniref:Uncharacterized protein n=1 Tax=Micromonospora phaseoli TaxID=1144548 RepID=A0A1H7DSY6_9ACTN|nr:hypothetical protein [Micromonospora phaseoli]PZV90003.1 hypothetical protein CLV64_11490 [Micromonospora phaseoli]GIJ78781.1 hypothetical protein Xph01_32130 [Micromonospora phaseoli]SEK03967.1 hypothetical protein SAMN05443287_11644 [Micromonospora phaseoli]